MFLLTRGGSMFSCLPPEWSYCCDEFISNAVMSNISFGCAWMAPRSRISLLSRRSYKALFGFSCSARKMEFSDRIFWSFFFGKSVWLRRRCSSVLLTFSSTSIVDEWISRTSLLRQKDLLFNSLHAEILQHFQKSNFSTIPVWSWYWNCTEAEAPSEVLGVVLT